ncbi:MAG: hypothetical protein DRO18_06790 [Thermoprotei archaeon]|nr:MAG: hypothetical protein DRO18_06790 [Thermoprotei archaeon]
MVLRVGVIGVGAWGKNHVRVYSELSEAELVFIADINEERARNIAKRYHVNYSTNYRNVTKYDVDAVSICVPTSAHYEVAKFMIESGIHILLEKPLTANYGLAKELVELAKDRGVRLMAGFIERFNPAVTYTKKLVSESKIGKVLAMYSERVSPRPLRIMDVNVLYDLGIHDVDVVRFILGCKVTQVYCELRKCKAELHDFAQLLLRLEGDVVAYVSTNWLTPKKIRLLRVLGTDGLITANYITQEVVIENNEGTFIPNKPYQEPLKLELSHFINSIVRGERFIAEGVDALETLKILSLAEESARKGAPVTP